MNENAIISANPAQDIITDINKPADTIYVSFVAETMEEKKLMYKATNGGVPISDVKNKVLELKDVIIIPVDLKNQDNTVSTVPRCSMICSDGVSYNATSWGVYNCLKRINSIFGTLHFEDGIKIVAKDVKTKNGSTISLELV